MAAFFIAIGSFLKSLWSRYQLIFFYLTSILVGVGVIFFKGKSAGRIEAEAKQREADDEARKRMEAVKPADPGRTIDSLREGRF